MNPVSYFIRRLLRLSNAAQCREYLGFTPGHTAPEVAADLADHMADFNNPHQVTAAQTGIISNRVRSSGLGTFPVPFGEIQFATTRPRVTLPEPGTYLVTGIVQTTASDSGEAGGSIKLRNVTDNVDVSELYSVRVPNDGHFQTVTISEIVTVAAGGQELQIWGQDAQIDVQIIGIGGSLLSFVRLH